MLPPFTLERYSESRHRRAVAHRSLDALTETQMGSLTVTAAWLLSGPAVG